MACGRRARPGQAGFTYLFVLMLIALIGMGLAAAGTLWHTESQRMREAELLIIGDQYRQAIRSFYEHDQTVPRLPRSIDELLEDNRLGTTARHLRRAYRDPFTGDAFALISMPDSQGIAGVHSRGTGRPFRRAGFAPRDEAFANAASYADWHFVYTPGDDAGTASPATP